MLKVFKSSSFHRDELNDEKCRQDEMGTVFRKIRLKPKETHKSDIYIFIFISQILFDGR